MRNRTSNDTSVLMPMYTAGNPAAPHVDTRLQYQAVQPSQG